MQLEISRCLGYGFDFTNHVKTDFLKELNFQSFRNFLSPIFFCTKNLLDVALPFNQIQANDFLNKKITIIWNTRTACCPALQVAFVIGLKETVLKSKYELFSGRIR